MRTMVQMAGSRHATTTSIVFLLSTLMSIAYCRDPFQLTSLFVDDQEVGAVTNLNFQLQINRASGTSVEDDDYLVIELPAGTTAAWDASKTPTCEMKNGGRAKKCVISDKRACRITLGA